MNAHRLIARMNQTHQLNRDADRFLQSIDPPVEQPQEPELRVVSLAKWSVKNLPMHDSSRWRPTLEELIETVKTWTPKRQMNYFLGEKDGNQSSNLQNNLNESKTPEQAGAEIVEHLQLNLLNEPIDELVAPDAEY